MGGSIPKTATLPDVGLLGPSAMSIVVVLPAPFGPGKATISPGLIVQLEALEGLDCAEALANCPHADRSSVIGHQPLPDWHQQHLTRGHSSILTARTDVCGSDPSNPNVDNWHPVPCHHRYRSRRFRVAAQGQGTLLERARHIGEGPMGR